MSLSTSQELQAVLYKRVKVSWYLVTAYASLLLEQRLPNTVTSDYVGAEQAFQAFGASIL
jgi:hypothetical protein